MTNTCKTCGKSLKLETNVTLILLSDYKRTKEVYCSLDCLYEYEKGQRTP